MKAVIIIPTFGLAVLTLSLASSVEAQHYPVEYGIGDRDDYIVVERRRARSVIIEEPAPQVVIVKAPPAPPRRVVVRPGPPCVGAIWVEGYWRYTGARFVWVRGHWIPPRRGYHFVQPRWHVHAGHYYYTPGYFRPHHAEVRRATYHRYRPRPGYVYYRGHERPHYPKRHPRAHHEHDRRHASGHHQYSKHHPSSQAKRPKHPNHGYGKHPARLEHKHGAPRVQRPPAGPQNRSSVSRTPTRSSRTARPNRGPQVGVVARR
jgi:hypothetical protein